MLLYTRQFQQSLKGKGSNTDVVGCGDGVEGGEGEYSEYENYSCTSSNNILGGKYNYQLCNTSMKTLEDYSRTSILA